MSTTNPDREKPAMPINRDEANHLAELLCTIRPSWNTRGVVVKGLAPLAKHPAPLEVIAWAAIRAAKDPENLTPAVIPLNGPHWNLADRPAPPRLTPENECKIHPGKWAGNCPGCAVEDFGHESDPQPEEPEYANARERAREAARAAKRALHIEPDDEPTDIAEQPLERPASKPSRPEWINPHEYGTPEHARWHHERHPERVGMGPDERRRAAAQDARPVTETGELCTHAGCYHPTEPHNHDPVDPDGSSSTLG